MACLIRAALSSMSRQAWNKSSMKLSVTMSRSGRDIRRGSAWAIGMSSFSCIGLKSRSNDDLSVDGSQDLSNEMSWATSPIVSLTLLNFVGAGDDPKGSRPSKYAMSSITVMHVWAACIFACIRRYAASISVLFIQIILSGCRCRMAWIPVMNLVSAWPYLHSSSSSFITRLLQLNPDGPGKVQSCVGRRLMIRSFVSFMDHWVATPSGVTLAPGISGMLAGRIGIAQWCFTSLVKALSRASLLSASRADLWFPRWSIYSMSDNLSSSEIG